MPFGQRHLEHAARAEPARVEVDHVDPAQIAGDLLDGGRDLVRVGDVGRVGPAVTAGRLALRGDLASMIAAQVDHGDAGAFGREPQRTGPADAVPAAGDHDRLAAEPAHRCPPRPTWAPPLSPARCAPFGRPHSLECRIVGLDACQQLSRADHRVSRSVRAGWACGNVVGRGASGHNTPVRETALSLVVRTVATCGKRGVPGPGCEVRGPRPRLPGRSRVPGPAAPISGSNTHTGAKIS